MGFRFHLLKLSFILGVSIFIFSSCSQIGEDISSMAVIKGYVYLDPDHLVGVKGVKVFVESDETSDNPYTGPDIIVETDSTGYYEAHVYLGHTYADSMVVHNYIADCSLLFIYKDKSERINGVTVKTGSTYKMFPVYVRDFE